jgi:DNA-binding NtrC family response regulator
MPNRQSVRKQRVALNIPRGTPDITILLMAETTEQWTPLNILVIDDEPNIRKMLSISLGADGHGVTGVSNGKEAIAQCARQPFDLAFVDLRIGTEQGLDLIPQLLAESTWLRVVVITAYATIETAVDAAGGE